MINSKSYWGHFKDIESVFFYLSKVIALYRGASSPLIGSMFINAILFGVEENVRKTLKYNASSDNINNKNSLEHYKFYAISGAIAGFAQSVLLSPIELVKNKMQIPNTKYANT